jgi:hypothetical protein
MLNASQIKSLALSLGADQCGIASIDRFNGAPGGFHPVDIYNKSRSVVVFLKKMPEEVIRSENPVVYTHTANYLYAFLDKVGLELCYELEKQGIKAVPVPTDTPYMHLMALLSTSKNAVLIQSWITLAAGAFIPARSAGRFARFHRA